MTSGGHAGAPSPELTSRARGGDPEARAALLEAERPRLLRFCRRYLADADAAEDTVQETIARLATGDDWPTGDLHPFLLRVARNRCLDTLRRRPDGRVGAGSLLGLAGPASATGPSTALAREERGERLRQHLLALPAHHAEVLVLRYFEDLGRADIGEVLELPTSVVRSRLFEARKLLRARIGEASL